MKGGFCLRIYFRCVVSYEGIVLIMLFKINIIYFNIYIKVIQFKVFCFFRES